MSRRIASVVGGGDCSPEEYEAARSVGRGLAEAGLVVLTGGRGGVMEAASRGAREAGGLTIGILPGSDRTEANEYLDVSIPTGLGDARNAVVAAAAHVVVAVGGAYGTLSEVALALKRGTPVIGLGTWPLDAARAPGREGIAVARDAADAVRLATASLS